MDSHREKISVASSWHQSHHRHLPAWGNQLTPQHFPCGNSSRTCWNNSHGCVLQFHDSCTFCTKKRLPGNESSTMWLQHHHQVTSLGLEHALFMAEVRGPVWYCVNTPLKGPKEWQSTGWNTPGCQWSQTATSSSWQSLQYTHQCVPTNTRWHTPSSFTLHCLQKEHSSSRAF